MPDPSAPTNAKTFAALGEFRPAGDLWTRLHMNFTCLEQERYWPENVFQRDRAFKKWPGDIEGRTLLAWILLEQATGRAARYLDCVIDSWPAELNERGYFGNIYTDGISEQQLSGHGWALQALAELERLRPGGPARRMADPLIERLFLPTAGCYQNYSIDPSERQAAGEYSGSHLKQIGAWILSTDVGCFGIGMAGLIDASEAFGRSGELAPLITEMIDCFLAIDLEAIRAQTHATLSACRGLLRWARIAGRNELVAEATRRYALYVDAAWTETHANFNWFGRPQWTEPCAVVDGLMVAMELWRLSGRSEYLEQAQLAWFNALGHGQRANGGFGCDNCPGADGEDDLFFKTEESHWCCSMRGAEGLARMTQFCAVRSGDTLCLPFGLPGSYASGPHRFEIESGYPRVARWTFLNRGPDRLRISLYLPSWVDDIPGRDSNGWLAIDLAPGSTHLVEGSLSKRSRPVLPSSLRLRPEAEGRHVHMEGPLILGQSGERWEPIAFDYQRGDLNKANSGKRILHTT